MIHRKTFGHAHFLCRRQFLLFYDYPTHGVIKGAWSQCHKSFAVICCFIAVKLTVFYQLPHILCSASRFLYSDVQKKIKLKENFIYQGRIREHFDIFFVKRFIFGRKIDLCFGDYLISRSKSRYCEYLRFAIR